MAGIRIFFVALLFSLPVTLLASEFNPGVRSLLVPTVNLEGLRAYGPDALPVMAQIYEDADETLKARIARAFYQLGWKSDEARRALMNDVHTTNPGLRLQVQWALGRVSNDDEVVSTLLDIMITDQNPRFRDKAACALAYDQIHLNEAQKLELLSGLVDALGDSKLQVRNIAIKALSIRTGQTKGFQAKAETEVRALSIQQWKAWLADYQNNM